MNRSRHRRGIFLADLMVALVMAMILLMAMTAAVSALYRGERRMADTRASARQLEAALAALQSGNKPEPAIAVTQLPDAAVSGQTWVRVSLPPERDGPEASLVGLVPAASVPAGGGR